MNELAATILSRGFLEDANGRSIPLHSHTSLAQAQFLEDQIQSINAATTLEIGLAYGISALCIADAIRPIPNAKHVAIDPFQNTPSWQGLGLKNLERAGLRYIVDFHESYAQDVLPMLIEDGLQIDFAYVDAGKRMDDILTFTHFLQRLLRVGGLIAYDDLAFPGIRKALRYIIQQDHFALRASFAPQPTSLLRRSFSALVRRTPGGSRLFAPELIMSDAELGLTAHCVVLEKVAEPLDDWGWHPNF